MELNLRDQSGYSACLPEVNSSLIYEKNETITKAVIIAAGNGSRLQGYQNNCPKPLIKVGGVPLLKRVILSAKKIGVTDFVIVLGYQAARIRKSISAKNLGVKITWVRNLDWRQPNGISVLRAEKYVDGRFFLFMSDHVFDPGILKKLKDAQLGKYCGALCVDYRLNKIPNLDDATKVRTEKGRLLNLGKSLADFNAIDVGIFVCTSHLFDALRQSQDTGEYALSDGVRVLAQAGKMCTFNIGDAYWQDVDTIPDIYSAERLLFRATRSEGDGIVAKLLNRKVSNRITKWLLKTPFTPNQVSFLNLCFSVFIAWLVSLGKPHTTIMGGLLFQLASILDGCDGEVALIKLKDSKFGALVDTITDHMSYFLFIIGVTIGTYRATQEPVVFLVTAMTLTFLLLALKFGLLYIKKRGSASLRDLDQGIAALNHSKQKVWYLRFFGLAHHLGRRDVFSFGAMVVMLWGNITVFYWALIAAVNLMSAGIGFSAVSMLQKSEKFNIIRGLKKTFSRMVQYFGSAQIGLEAEQEISD